MPGGTILLVDDEPDIRETLRETLEYEGYTAAEASNGLEALTYLRSNPRPCLILLDLMMPVMNGFDFMNTLRQDPALSALPILIVSAASRSTVEAAAAHPPAVGVLPKPIQLAPLLSAVERYC